MTDLGRQFNGVDSAMNLIGQTSFTLHILTWLHVPSPSWFASFLDTRFKQMATVHGVK